MEMYRKIAAEAEEVVAPAVRLDTRGWTKPPGA
jgi:hypothetical protein